MRSSFIARLVLVFSMAVLAMAISYASQYSSFAGELALGRKVLHGEVITWSGQIAYPIYNRILFPAIAVTVAGALPTFNDTHLFIALRFAAFCACFFLLFRSIEKRAVLAGTDPVAACVMLAVAFAMTLVPHPSPHTSDIFDLTIMFYVFVYLFEERLVAAFLLACLTAVNREAG